MSNIVSAILVTGALFAGSPDVLVRATEKGAPEATISALSGSVVAGLTSAGQDAAAGAAWAGSCADDACVREAMSGTSAAAVVILSVEQHDNVYRFSLEARDADSGERLATVDDTCEICGLDEVAELVELRAAALGERLDRPTEGTLSVTSEPAGAEVYLDGNKVGMTPIELSVAEGAHSVRLVKRGFLDDTRTVDVQVGMEDSMRFKLVAEPEGSAVARRWYVAGGVSMGLGVVGLAAGIPLMLLDTKPYEGNCRADPLGNCAKLYDTMGVGASLTTAGVIGLGAGTAMVLIGRKHSRSRAELEPAPGGLAVRF